MRKNYFSLILGTALLVGSTFNSYAEPDPVPETALETVSETVAETMPETVLESTPETMPGESLVEETITETVVEDEAIETIPETEISVIEETAPSISEEITPEILEEEDDIEIVDGNRLDENGRLSVEVQLPNDAVLPYKIILNGPEGDVNFEIAYNGQLLLIKPGTYKVKSVKDGNNKSLDKGARIAITEDTDAIYLDFNNPNKDDSFNILSILTTNLTFVILAGLGFFGFKKYCDYIGLKK